MKEKNKYHISDIINLIVFYTIFLCFFAFFVIGIVDFAQGTLPTSRLLFRIAFLFLMCLPYIIKKTFKITFSKIVSIVFYFYMFIAAFLGNVLDFYSTVPVWDLVIHFIMGVVLSIASIYILNYTIYKKDKNRHNLFFTILFMLLFSMGIGALWEIWEFCGDLIFGLNSQRYLSENLTALVGQTALLDTMLDICMDFLGTLVGILIVLLMLKIDNKFLKKFTIKKLKKEEIENIEE